MGVCEVYDGGRELGAESVALLGAASVIGVSTRATDRELDLGTSGKVGRRGADR